MVVPSTALGILFLLVLVIPGTVYAAVRTAVGGRGPHDNELGTRILRAVIASVVLNAAYLLIFGDWLIELFTRDGVTASPRAAGGAALALGIVVPALLAYVVHGRPKVERGALAQLPPWLPASLSRWLANRLRRLPWTKTTTGYETTPTAWDWALHRSGGKWLRVRMAPGKWVGGWFGGQSIASTYPEARDLFIERQHHIADDGVIGGPVDQTSGVWLAVEDGHIVEWLDDQSDEQQSDSIGGDDG